MLKVRLMGTQEDIKWFQGLLQGMPELGVIGISDIYANSGTDRFYRNYIELEKNRVELMAGNEKKVHDAGKQVHYERY